MRSYLYTKGFDTLTFHTEEYDDSYILAVDLPGVKREDVNIELKDRVLTLHAERKGSRGYTVDKRIKLSDDISTDSVKANMLDGVLFLGFTKAEEARARKIEIV